MFSFVKSFDFRAFNGVTSLVDLASLGIRFTWVYFNGVPISRMDWFSSHWDGEEELVMDFLTLPKDVYNHYSILVKYPSHL